MIDKLFNIAKKNELCNTSYPLNKQSWLEYKVIQQDLFLNEKNLCLYIHIPFCQSLCSFCEYIKFNKDDNKEKKYIEILENDINNFLKNHKIEKLYGFDIGGGTPTVLSVNNFKKLMNIVKSINEKIPHVDDYEPSIEGTFSTITEEKIKLIKEAGINRISFGIQTVNTKILMDNNRVVNSYSNMKKILDTVNKYDMKVNLDLMYGIPNQKTEDIYNTLEIIEKLNPTQVTLYEMRYNMVNMKMKYNKDQLYDWYKILYDCLIKLGYKARFGQNTFSKYDDLGLSSYLRYRMIYNISYKGFGISAQSKSNIGLSYNIGKSKESFEECIKKNTFFEDDIYLLPKEELLAKYIAVCMYYGLFKLSIMKKIINKDPLKEYKNEFNYLIDNNYIVINDDDVTLTKKGFKYFGSIGALFYSKKTKEELLGEKND